MRIYRAPIWAAFFLLSAGPVAAQQMYPGQSVTVNPGAAGSRTLLYPGGEYLRLQRPLLQPGQKNAPIQLRRPGTRRPTVTASAAPAPRAPEAAPRPAAAPAPTPAPRPAPAPQAAAAPAPKPAPAPAARPAAPASGNEFAGWTNASQVSFKPDQTEVEGSFDLFTMLAGVLKQSLSESPHARVELIAYGGKPGDKGSEARRIALRRALSVRQLLINNGISEARIGVRAMGGADDGRAPDRVDVYTHN